MKRIVFISCCALVILGSAWLHFKLFPATCGYCAKTLCSAIYVQGRSLEEVTASELSDFPLSLVNSRWDPADSAVHSRVGWIRYRTAIYRKGYGASLIPDGPEKLVPLPALDSRPHTQHDSVLWPIGDLVPDSWARSSAAKRLEGITGLWFDDKNEDGQRLTTAFLIVHKGILIAERYAEGYSASTPLLGWSVAKSMVAALIGTLVQEGRISVDDTVSIGPLAGYGITVEDLLQQRSGLKFREVYDRPSEVVRMLYSESDMAGYVSRLPLEHPPGTVFNYTGGNTNLLCAHMRELLPGKAYYTYPRKALFERINAESMLLEVDASGTFVGSSYIYATARDYARFGMLYLADGVWKGERILPAGWVEATRTADSINPYRNHSYQFWLNGRDKRDSTRQAYPGVPSDLFYADGYLGQDIFIIPSMELVIVRMGIGLVDGPDLLRRTVDALE